MLSVSRQDLGCQGFRASDLRLALGRSDPLFEHVGTHSGAARHLLLFGRPPTVAPADVPASRSFRVRCRDNLPCYSPAQRPRLHVSRPIEKWATHAGKN